MHPGSDSMHWRQTVVGLIYLQYDQNALCIFAIFFKTWRLAQIFFKITKVHARIAFRIMMPSKTIAIENLVLTAL